MAIDNKKIFLEILARWDNALMLIIILLGCVSVIMDFFFKNKNTMVTYFLVVFLLNFAQFFTLFTEYISSLKYQYYKHLYYLALDAKTIYLVLWFMFFWLCFMCHCIVFSKEL